MHFNKLITTAIKLGVVFVLFFWLLFSDEVLGSSFGIIGSALRKATVIFRDPGTQWMIFLCLGIYATALLILNSHTTRFCRVTNATLWLACALLISAILYAIDYSPYTQAITLLGGAVLGQGIAGLANFESKKLKQNCFGKLVVSLLMIALALASVWQMGSMQTYQYRDHVRWSGPWENPNIFGLLMGVGFSMTIGIVVIPSQMGEKARVRFFIWRLVSRHILIVISCLIAAGLMARGLIYSYSRGAWLGTMCGLVYLLSSSYCRLGFFGNCKTTQISGCSTFNSLLLFATLNWLRRNGLTLIAVFFCVGILFLWHYQETNWNPGKRAFSAINAYDFSWRNRIDAWVGALQIAAEHPWFGAGWNQPEPLYEHYYLSPKLSEGAAIEMNDYLMFAATLGIPSLFCFGMYIWLCLTQWSIRVSRFRSSIGMSYSPNHNNSDVELGRVGFPRDMHAPHSTSETLMSKSVTTKLNRLQIMCRAAAIILLVGFWFDGGLFKLPTAATFWILLELGARQSHHEAEKSA